MQNNDVQFNLFLLALQSIQLPVTEDTLERNVDGHPPLRSPELTKDYKSYFHLGGTCFFPPTLFSHRSNTVRNAWTASHRLGWRGAKLVL
jgi:hypothetical protein